MSSTLRVNELQNLNGTSAMTIDSTGAINRTYLPAFHAYGINNGTYTTTGDVPFNTTLLNNGNHFSTSTYTFTAPVSGIYSFSVMGLFNTIVIVVFIKMMDRILIICNYMDQVVLVGLRHLERQ